MNLKRSNSIVLRVILFVILVTFLTSFFLSTAQSSSSGTVAIATRAFGGAPAFQAPSTPYLYFFPFIGKAPNDLTISSVQVSQGTIPSSNYAVYIANRPTMVRAYVAVTNAATAPGVVGRMDIYNSSGGLLGSVTSNTITAPSSETPLSATLNFTIPSELLLQASSYSIVVDPNNAIVEADENNNRYPSSGNASFNFVSESPLQVVIVPILYLPYGAQVSTTPDLSNISNLLWMANAAYPVPAINYRIHSNVDYIPNPNHPNPQQRTYNLNDSSGAGWQNLLDKITAVHVQEDPSRSRGEIYYGLVNTADAHNGCSGCITGLGWVGVPTAVGWSGNPNGSPAEGEIFAHEVGHTLGREHVRCRGDESFPDPNYPYSGGYIGVWGLDVEAATLYSPSLYADYMSYCSAQWTSDYTYAGIKSFRDSATYAPIRLNTQAVPAMYVSGTFAPTGAVTLHPIYQQLAPVNVPSGGTHTLELLGNGGAVIASYPFTPTRSPDSKGFSGFGFFVPAENGLTGIRVTTNGRIIGEKTVSAPMAATDLQLQPTTTQRAPTGVDTVLNWGSATHPTESIVYRVRISHDSGVTWQVLALDLPRPQFQLPPGVDLANALIEIQASDGIHTTTRVVSQ